MGVQVIELLHAFFRELGEPLAPYANIIQIVTFASGCCIFCSTAVRWWYKRQLTSQEADIAALQSTITNLKARVAAREHERDQAVIRADRLAVESLERVSKIVSSAEKAGDFTRATSALQEWFDASQEAMATAIYSLGLINLSMSSESAIAANEAIRLTRIASLLCPGNQKYLTSAMEADLLNVQVTDASAKEFDVIVQYGLRDDPTQLMPLVSALAKITHDHIGNSRRTAALSVAERVERITRKLPSDDDARLAAFFIMGTALAANGRHSEAAEIFRDLLRRHEDEPETAFIVEEHLMDSLAEQGLADEAIKIASRLNAIKPNDPFILVQAAFCYAVRGNVAESRTLLDRAIERAAKEGIEKTELKLRWVKSRERVEAHIAFAGEKAREGH